MNRILLVAALAATTPTLASAQTAAGSHNPAVKNPAVAMTTGSAQGRNSFTQSQAKGRIAKAGYTGVGRLTKDADGVWQGKAMKGGRSVMVALDYKGDVTAR